MDIPTLTPGVDCFDCGREVEFCDCCRECSEARGEGFAGCGECLAPAEQWEVTAPVGM